MGTYGKLLFDLKDAIRIGFNGSAIHTKDNSFG